MSDESLPPVWIKVPFADLLVKLANGTTVEQHKEPPGIPVSRIETISEAKINFAKVRYVRDASAEILERFLIQAGDILFSHINSDSHLGKCALYRGGTKLLHGMNLLLIRVAPIADPAFIERYLTYLRASGYFIQIAQHAVNQSSLNQKKITQIPIPLPPLPEQKRIVAKIEELFSELEAGEESLRAARRQLGVYRQSLLKQAFEGKLTETWRAENPDKLESPAQLLARIQAAREARYEQQLCQWRLAMAKWEDGDQTSSKPRRPGAPDAIEALPSEVLKSMPSLPSSWFWGRLGSMTLGVEYGTAAKSSKTGKCPVIRMGNLQGGEIDWSDLVFTSDETEIGQYRLEPGDVLFNRTNSPELVGKTAIYRGNRPAIFAGYLIRINHIPDIVCSGYLNYFLNSAIARNYGNSVKTDGVNQSNINGAKLVGYPFPYCSLPEQQEIVRLLDEQFEAIERNEREIDAALKRSEALRQAILKKAFTGQLVPQDPADEPASVLLERMTKEQINTNSRPRRKRPQKEVLS